MKASKFSDAQKAFILKQGSDGMPVAEICRKAGISQATYSTGSASMTGCCRPRCDGGSSSRMRTQYVGRFDSASLSRLAGRHIHVPLQVSAMIARRMTAKRRIGGELSAEPQPRPVARPLRRGWPREVHRAGGRRSDALRRDVGTPIVIVHQTQYRDVLHGRIPGFEIRCLVKT